MLLDDAINLMGDLTASFSISHTLDRKFKFEKCIFQMDYSLASVHNHVCVYRLSEVLGSRSRMLHVSLFRIPLK